MVTLASTTSLSTVLKLLTVLHDALAQIHVASSEPLAKGLHLGDQRPPLGSLARPSLWPGPPRGNVRLHPTHCHL